MRLILGKADSGNEDNADEVEKVSIQVPVVTP